MWVLFVLMFASLAAAEVRPTLPAQCGVWGCYPNCIAPAVGVENHSWWQETRRATAHHDANRFTDDNAPRHLHLAACLPNARLDGSVQSVPGTPFVARIMLYNNPSVITFVRWGFQSRSDSEQRINTNLACTTAVASHTYMSGRSQCIWYIDLALPSTAGIGVDELRLTPNIADHVDLGTRQFSTLNFQLDTGGSGRYRGPEHPLIGRSWYTGLEYGNATVQYVQHFQAGQNALSVPVVAGVVPIALDFGGNAQRGAVWQDMNHHMNPTFWRTAKAGDVDGETGGKLLFEAVAGKHVLYWDTTVLANGRHTLYVQAQASNDQGLNAGALALWFDVRNGPVLLAPAPPRQFSLTNLLWNPFFDVLFMRAK